MARFLLQIAVLSVTVRATTLDAASFEKNVIQDDQAWLVQFCPSATACKKFAPTWSALTASLTKLTSGTLDTSSGDGAAIATAAGAAEGADSASMWLFTTGSDVKDAIRIAAPPPGASEKAALKTLRKRIFPHVKGLPKKGGKFLKATFGAENMQAEVSADGTVKGSSGAGGGTTGHPKTKRYFLYDVGPGERFNMRKAIVQRPLATIAALAKDTDDSWTLVLPPFKQFRSEEHENWAKFFDTLKLRAVWKHVIEFDQFIREVGDRIDFVYLPQECPAELQKERDFPHNAFGVSITVGSIKCNTERLDADDARLIKLIKQRLRGASIATPKVVFIPGYEQISPPFDYEQKMKVQGALRFAPLILEQAEKFHKEEMGGRKYVSMHLRRGDFLRNHKEHAPSADDVIKAVKAITDGAGVKDFYLSTNGSPEEVDGLRKACDTVGVKLHRFGSAFESSNVGETKYEGHGKFSSLQVATIEQALASKGEVFCGTLYSTFSMQIHHERHALGYKWDETDRTISPGPKLTPLCNYNDRPNGKYKTVCNDCDFDDLSGKGECMPW